MIYPTSTDYELLHNLAYNHNVVINFAYLGINDCLRVHPLMSSDFGKILHIVSKVDNYSFKSKESFIDKCKEKNLQWIVPTTAYIGEKYTIQIIPRFTKRDYQWIAVVSWKEEVVYYAMFQFDKIETYAYTQPLANLLVNHLDYCTTIEEALKQGLEIVKQLQANEN
jgi:hypothetical protein